MNETAPVQKQDIGHLLHELERITALLAAIFVLLQEEKPTERPKPITTAPAPTNPASKF